LVADLEDVAVLDLIEQVEGGIETDRCVMADQPCPNPQPCALHDAWIPARDALTERLAATPISSLTTKPEVTS
jgi:DNA-binding IscR family transcriptional regulator